MSNHNLYDALGVDPGASADELKQAFRAKAKNCHPDHHPGDAAAEAEFKAIAQAYAVLSDPEKRRRYDATGDEGGQPKNDLSSIVELVLGIFQDIRRHEGEEIWFMDPVARIRDVLEMSKLQIYGKVRKAGKQKRDARKLARKLKFDGDRGGSFLHGFLENEQRQARMQIAGLRKQLLLMRRARKLLEEYSFEVEQRENTPSPMGIFFEQMVKDYRGVQYRQW